MSPRVLLIEDDAVFQRLVLNYLQQQGYIVEAAYDGEQGLRYILDDPPDIVLCDLNLPHMSGLHVLEALLKQAQHIPVIVISASEDMSDIREAVRLGAWDYLVKPVQNLQQLDFAIHNCLDRQQLEHAHERELSELDHHIDMLYRDPQVVERLIADMRPLGSLTVGAYTIEHSGGLHQGLTGVDEWVTAPQQVLIDYRQLPQHQVLLVMAVANAVADQTLISLLVLKTLLNPLVRQAFSQRQHTLMPELLLQQLNVELCHSKIRTAYDVTLVILDTEQHTLQVAQAGQGIIAEPQQSPDLSLGIWQHANFHAAKCELGPGQSFSCRVNDAQLRVVRSAGAA